MRTAALLVLALLVAGCVERPESPTAPSSPAQYTGAPVAEHLDFAADDGVALDIWVFRPDTSATSEKVPVVINYSPYWSNLEKPAADGGDLFSSYLIERYVPRGYAIALVSVRGTGLSEGCFSIGGPREVQDADEVATFLAEQPWSNGNVGATAKSYDGTSAQYLLATGNPHLRTIVPVSPISDWYRYTFYGGVAYSGSEQFNTQYAQLVSLQQSQDPQDGTYQRTPTRFCDESLDVQLSQYRTDVTGDYTDYWAERNYTAMLPATLNASVFYVHGLSDWNVKPDHMRDWIDALHERNVTLKMWLGQWHHEYPHRGDWNDTLLAWFDSELKGIDNGITSRPLVQVQDSEGIWRDEDAWPPARALATAYFPSSDGALAPEPGSGSSMYADGANGALAQLPFAGTVAFESAPLDRDVRITGIPVLTATVSATGPRATLAAALLVDGAVVDQGFLDLAHRNGLQASEPMLPGTSYQVTVPFYPQDIVVHKGSTITLVLGSAAPPNAIVNITSASAGGLVTLTHGEGTVLTLPIVEGEDVRIEATQPEDLGCWTC
ncbi:MAG TPA: CocE/NonD family hydrolase [Candidatus Thermoplasmatota archaeon]|nr:CocE/NonD family hydrolase [Candidatus Thermoplasmatota archaeon]